MSRDLHRFLSNFEVIELDSDAAMEFGRIKVAICAAAAG